MSIKDITKSHTMNEKILIDNVNNKEVICKKKNCNKKCFKMHYEQIAECLLAFSLTDNIARTQMLAHRIRFDFPFKKSPFPHIATLWILLPLSPHNKQGTVA